MEGDYTNVKRFSCQIHNCGTEKAEKQPTDLTSVWIDHYLRSCPDCLIIKQQFNFKGTVIFSEWVGWDRKEQNVHIYILFSVLVQMISLCSSVLHGGSSLSKQQNFKEKVSHFTEFYIKAMHKASHDFYVAA